jgi:BirA family biotin operon repressor/biotin-[acetyl-CoA-carboxylase] ligase
MFWRLEIVESVESTSDSVMRRAEQGEAEGLALLARRQIRGKGRRDRVWIAPEGNLNLSVLLRPDQRLGHGHWALLAGIACRDALAEFCPAGVDLRLKWPNDIMLEGRKLAGLLVEGACGANGGGEGRWLVVGMGANLREVPPDLDRPLACLAEASASGVPPEPEMLAGRILSHLAVWREGHDAETIRAAWLARAHPVGTPLIVSETGLSGIFVGLDADTALLLAVAGEVHRVTWGEVAWRDS